MRVASVSFYLALSVVGCGGKTLDDTPPATHAPGKDGGAKAEAGADVADAADVTDVTDVADASDVAAPPPDGVNPFRPGDDWRGIYTCWQGPTNVDLHIVSVDGNTVGAIFEFDWPDHATGSYDVAGTFDPQTSTATFTPGAWVTPSPIPWVPVGMSGTAAPDTYWGKITNTSCGSFSVTKQ